MTNMHIILAGVRGTLPMHTPAAIRYGGATACVFVKAGNQIFILDAGSGLNEAWLSSFSQDTRFTMLLSHPHVDHLAGFPVFRPFFDPSCRCDIYLKTRDRRDARTQITALMSPPLWPVTPDVFRADVRFHDVPQTFSIGDVTVETCDVRHPGGCTAYRLSYHGASIVYATDFEAEENEPEFTAFARNASLLLLDAQYTQDEYIRTRGFGHSTIQRSIAIAKQCCAEKTVFIHHDPSRTDETLQTWDDALTQSFPSMHFGRVGEELFL